MSISKYIDYEITLLLAKYGKSAVLDSLSKQLQLTAEELETILEQLLFEKRVSRSRKRPSSADVLVQLVEEYPSKAQLLQTLYDRFGDRTFLREFRDIKRLFERHARPLGALKSRAESLPKLFTLLAELDVAELEAMCQTKPEEEYSSLGVISDAILRRDR